MQNKTKNPAATVSFDPDLAGQQSLRGVERPAAGWLRAIRLASGVSAGELGRRLGVSRQLPLQFERAEAADTITLKSLRAVAAALGCELVYALVPRDGGLEIRAESSVGAAEIAEKPSAARTTKSAIKTKETEPPPEKSNVAAPAPDVTGTDLHFCD
jgi:predicted DNA-binding mobile mystery protein A